MKYEIRKYEYSSGDYRDEIIVHEGTVWIVYIVGGMGMDSKCLAAGEQWQEGSDELMSVYETQQAAQAAIDRYFA